MYPACLNFRIGLRWTGGRRPFILRDSPLARLAPQDNGLSQLDTTTVKSRLRREAIVRRDALPADERRRAAETIAARPFPVAIPAGFMAMKSEINPLPLMRKLADAGAMLALPVVAGRGKPLIMRAWAVGEPLAAGQWGIREPRSDAATVDPDILLVPMLAFDRRGHRIGYGAGYYDMTITALRAAKKIVAVGIAFAAQEIDAVPSSPRDAPLDLVLTEREVIDFRNVGSERGAN
jgi:5-formyltetrahydrofolate cyclo-ligase